jgi:hypothetical protein
MHDREPERTREADDDRGHGRPPVRVKTRASVAMAPTLWMLPAQNTSVVRRSVPRRKWSAPWTTRATAKITAAYCRMRSSSRDADVFARTISNLRSGPAKPCVERSLQ